MSGCLPNTQLHHLDLLLKMLWLPGHCISDSSCLCFDCPQRYCQRLLSFTRPDLYCWSKWGVILHMAVKTKNMILGPLQLVAKSRRSSRSAVTLFTSLWKSVVLLIRLGHATFIKLGRTFSGAHTSKVYKAVGYSGKAFLPGAALFGSAVPWSVFELSITSQRKAQPEKDSVRGTLGCWWRSTPAFRFCSHTDRAWREALGSPTARQRHHLLRHIVGGINRPHIRLLRTPVYARPRATERIPVTVLYGCINICIITVLCLIETHVSLPLKTVGRGGVWKGKEHR